MVNTKVGRQSFRIMKNDPCYLSCEASLGILSVAGNFESYSNSNIINSSLKMIARNILIPSILAVDLQ